MKKCIFANIEAGIENGELTFEVDTNINLSEKDIHKLKDIFFRALLKNIGLSDEKIEIVAKNMKIKSFKKESED